LISPFLALAVRKGGGGKRRGVGEKTAAEE